MKTQKHNEGELSDLAVNIEKKLVEDFKQMSDFTGISIDELVCVALKRFRNSHADYMEIKLDYP